MKSSRGLELSGNPRIAAGRTVRIAMAAAALLVLAGGATAAYPWARGYALYHGHGPLNGRIAGHDDDLPAAASRCSNCHEGVAGGDPAKWRIAALSAASLSVPASRRGGPPSAYSEASFCAVLRDGIDAAFIQVPRTMPRFAMKDRDCHALWIYVTSR